MSKSDRAWLIGGAVGAATFFGQLLMAILLMTGPIAAIPVAVLMMPLTFGAIAIGVATGVAWSRIEEWATQTPKAQPAADSHSTAPEFPTEHLSPSWAEVGAAW